MLESLHDQYKDEELGQFALVLCTEVKRDQDTLPQIINHVGKATLDKTEGLGWVSEGQPIQAASDLGRPGDSHFGIGGGQICPAARISPPCSRAETYPNSRQFGP